MRTIAAITVGRSDFGIFRPVLSEIGRRPDLSLIVIASGAHMASDVGNTIDEVRDAALGDIETFEMLLASDTPEGIGKSIGVGVIGFAQILARRRPDMVLVLGDRYEMLAAVVAAMPHAIPIAHIHGGESTEGAIDEQIRHAITKISHLHFVSTREYGRRIVQMGEHPSRVHISGAPSLDNLNDIEPASMDELQTAVGMPLSPTPLLVTFHPVTLEYQRAGWQIDQLLTALKQTGLPVVLTLPNADTSGRKVRQSILRYTSENPNARAVENLGTRRYFGLMKSACAMVGNSSSGIIEAASFGLPVVNIGTRQAGRLKGDNVIDCGYEASDIVRSVRRAVSPEFRELASKTINPYGDGNAALRIVNVLEKVTIDDALIQKRFYDIDIDPVPINGLGGTP